ncbi:MAG: bile acid:sodium symporter family protein [Pseudomonadota bacterium]
MDILIDVVLPLSLAIIMFSLGIGLTARDFGRVLRRPIAFMIGACAQVILLPLVAFGIVYAFDLPPGFALGVMLLSFCPGGVTSNMISKLSRADVALSVSLTAVISLLSILTVPFLATWAVLHFLGEDAPDISITSLAIALFLITTLPVLLGVLIRHLRPDFADRVDGPMSTFATVLFILIVVAALASNWGLFVENVMILGPALITLNLSLLLIGFGIAYASGLNWPESKAVSVETGIQNATLGITLAALISQQDGFGAMSIPSAVYGITMYLCAAPFVAWYRSR